MLMVCLGLRSVMYRAEIEEKVGQVGWDWSLEWLHTARGNRKAQEFSWILGGLLVRMWGL